MTLLDRRYFTDAALAFATFVALAVPVAVVVAATDAQYDRRLLHYGFAHIPHEAGQVAAIFTANLSVLLPFLLMAAVVQLRFECRTAFGQRVFTHFCDVVVAAPVVHDLELALGEALGAYGTRMLERILLAGPVELAAFALAASVYLRSRRTRVTAAHAVSLALLAAISAATLLAAAVIETYQ
jgi:hypothetical protein